MSKHHIAKGHLPVSLNVGSIGAIRYHLLFFTVASYISKRSSLGSVYIFIHEQYNLVCSSLKDFSFHLTI